MLQQQQLQQQQQQPPHQQQQQQQHQQHSQRPQQMNNDARTPTLTGFHPAIRSSTPFTPPPQLTNGHALDSPPPPPTASGSHPSPPKTFTRPPSARANSPNKLPDSLTRPTSFSLPPNKLPVSVLYTKQEELGPSMPFPPSLSILEQRQMKEWVNRDASYEQTAIRERQSRRVAVQEIFREAMGQRGDWLGDRTGGRSTKIRMPMEDERERAGGKRKGRPPTLRLDRRQTKLVAENEEVLVPIRLEIEVEHWKLRDTFTWNLREPVVTPEVFAVHLCEDLILPAQHFTPLIVSAIKEQLEDYRMHENMNRHHTSIDPGHDLAWWAAWRENPAKRLKLEHETEPEPEIESGLGDDELRISINLDIISGSVHLLDKFEWEISEPRNCPEDFAETYANDLGLAGEFKTAIAHSIREQIETYVKSLALVEHVPGLPVPNDELRYAFLTPVTEPVRTALVADDHTPFLALLTPDELDRQEKEHDREARRKRRQTRARRGVTLPDRDAPRTVRTIVPRQGVKMVMPYMDENEDTVVPVQPVVEPYPIKESIVEFHEPAEAHSKRISATSKDHLLVEPAPVAAGSTTPVKAAAGHRSSRRLRGATADVSVSADTPPPLSAVSTSITTAPAQAEPENEDTPTPTAGAQKKSQMGLATKKGATGSTRPTRGVNWEAHGLHDPMINGVWHCSNCGCPEQVAVGRRKGPGGKDTLCGECGRYMHRFKKNRPALYNTSADYHTSLKLEADKAQQAVAEQAQMRKEKSKLENSALSAPGSSTKKRKKEVAAGALVGRPKRAGSVKSGVSGSRESSPAVIRAEKRAKAIQLPTFKKARVDHALTPAGPVVVAKEEEPEPDSPSAVVNETLAPPKVPPARPIPGPASSSSRTTPTSASSRPSEGRTGEELTTNHQDQPFVDPQVQSEAVTPKPASSAPSHAPSRSSIKRGRPRVSPANSTESRPKGKLPGNTAQKTVATQQTAKAGPPPAVAGVGAALPTVRRAGPIVPGPGRPEWMTHALAELRTQYPNDRVELVPKIRKEAPAGANAAPTSGPGWRLKCLDCPGKLYTVGPEESFNNFVVHLKNRQHRQKVDERIQGPSAAPAPAPAPAEPSPTSDKQGSVTEKPSPATTEKPNPMTTEKPNPSTTEKSNPSTTERPGPPVEKQGAPPLPPPPPVIVLATEQPPPPSPASASASAPPVHAPPLPPTPILSLPPPPILPPHPHHHHYQPPPAHHRHTYNGNNSNSGHHSNTPLPPPTLVHPLPKKPML
ncbi:hypothetical protein CROQUDRAFT_673849 [Cronartium quercuum f. sp. fusiforme G11]|uniref:SNF5-domain-containing protein n=1 Tax=Cronartium quercuum f. sp. fusiforme G11 TaxID=708437 RepID=A0A9P6N8L5_9BASI|nr:hypothetical protein CROQUDRAFT_673849 [Cronartium quercuum f. sp. fusiforme G11]